MDQRAGGTVHLAHHDLRRQAGRGNIVVESVGQLRGELLQAGRQQRAGGHLQVAGGRNAVHAGQAGLHVYFQRRGHGYGRQQRVVRGNSVGAGLLEREPVGQRFDAEV